ncbi:hypothetical protein JW758_01625 [Candidatus Peregrinibacteria bacterium]|nr:hypothetical protein [Candidatus Peregrinibacteria bacterium]
MRKRIRQLLNLLLVTLILSWIVFLFIFGPEKIIFHIGTSNGYLLAFASAFFGDLATISALSVYPAIIAFAIGGLNPLILGISAAFGITLANLVFFYIGLKSHNVVKSSSKFAKFNNKIIGFINNKPDWIIPILIWAYIGLSPFPNNLLTAGSGLINYPIKKILPPLFLGNITLMTLIAYFSIIGIEILK